MVDLQEDLVSLEKEERNPFLQRNGGLRIQLIAGSKRSERA
jgi:hypothetical protein